MLNLMPDLWLWLKALHIIAIVCWFAGLFYLPRLFVYHSMTNDQAGRERFCIMERKLYRAIMWPAMVATVTLGIALLFVVPVYLKSVWLCIKLLLVTTLIVYHLVSGHLLKQFAAGENKHSHVFYRVFNELPTLALFFIVILAIVKPFGFWLA